VNWLFWTCAALMLVAALIIVLRPLLRQANPDDELRRKLAALDAAHAAGVIEASEYASKRAALSGTTPSASPSRSRALPAIALAGVLPCLAFVVYFATGTPEALQPGATTRPAAAAGGDAGAPANMDEAIASLAARLESEPDDLQGWLLLGRAYKAVGRFADARKALDRARAVAPDDLDTLVEYAEAISLEREDRLIEGEARSLLERALAGNPVHQRALWLLGIADAQAGNYAAAVGNWERLLPLLEPGSEVAQSVSGQIAEARQRAGMPPAEGTPPAAPSAPALATEPSTAAAAASAPAADAAASGGPRLTIIVDISPELRQRVAATDTLYVFARAPSGPRMPLALQRLTAANLPVTVVLDDSMGMMPQLTLSGAAEVVVGARISKSGVANPQSGDLEGLSAALAPATATDPIRLTIDRVVP
jgi:cytochrome c-type biogenesis protein CcmH